MKSLWKPGEHILIRHIWQNRVRYAHPVTVVQDTGERILVYLQIGTPIIWARLDFSTGNFDDPLLRTWHSNNVLKILEIGASHAVSLMWDAADGQFKKWYIDLQEKNRRVADGLVTWDRSLDIVVTPDLNWKWKDEDHFQRIQELGWLAPDETQFLREEAKKVITQIEQRQEPFCDPWPQWRPDPAWPTPALPDNWAELP